MKRQYLKKMIFTDMKNITDADHRHRKRVCTDFEIKNPGRFYDLHAQICLETYELNSVSFLNCTKIIMASSLKKSKVKLDILHKIDILLMKEKVSEEEYFTLVVNMQKIITNT